MRENYNCTVQLTCQVCGKKYYPIKRREKKSKYCSLQCNGMAKRGQQSGIREYFDRYAKPNNGCWVWTGPIGGGMGYGVANIGRKRVLAHRVSYELHKAPIPPGMVIMHECDNPKCVNPQHLLLGTHRDNHIDMRRKARGMTKLGPAEVLAIRNSDATLDALASKFGVSQTTINSVRQRRTWAWLGGDVLPVAAGPGRG